MPDTVTATQGPPSVVLEVIDSATHVDHNYTKSAEEATGGHSADKRIDEASFPTTEKEVFMDEGSVEAAIACCKDCSHGGGELFSRASSPALSHLDKEGGSPWDPDSNSGYGWPLPSDVLSALDDGSSLDMDACELFPQLTAI